MRVLVVKLTSMGDLIHVLPALTDASKALTHIEFDWVVDEAFAEIPSLHPNVHRIIKSAHRRWTKAKWRTIKSGELTRFLQVLRQQHYDLVIDAQSSIKSALITRFCKGLRSGMDKSSVREYGAHLAYQRQYPIPSYRTAPAIFRQRLLFAKALGYTMPDTPPDFNININALPLLDFHLPTSPYLMFIHNTTWSSKHWPERYWTQLIQIANQQGYHVVLPWGNQKEEERAKRLSHQMSNTTVLPSLGILGKARVIAGASGVVTVDTGLAHLTAAMNIPAVHLYGPTDPNLLAVKTPTQKSLFAAYPCAPCYLHQCKLSQESECFIKVLTPNKVWDALRLQLNSASPV